MSRISMPSQRTLTLTEELEKIEQSITLTLQEIDHNFSRAHRIVTTSILPVVEQYAEHSKNVWEGSKFWKQFFEASANVSLSGYEEPPAEEEEETITDDHTLETNASSSAYASPSQEPADQTLTPTNANESSFFDTTPQVKPNPGASRPPTIAPYSSPYETLKRQVQGLPPTDPSSSTLPSTPQNHPPSPLTVQSSPFLPPSTTRRPSHRTPANDILLHRILDKNWRLQATPHTQPRLPKPSTHKNPSKPYSNPADDSLDSSPPAPAPELHSEVFGSPVRRIPGVSILTPARGAATKKPFSQKAPSATPQTHGGIWDSDSDEDAEMEGMSPPKTMQFHIPQSRLLQTPAREASKRIVSDILLTAGGNISDEPDEDSPSVIKRGTLLDEDTF